MAGKEEGVYEKFLSFLRSPMWALPVMGFVEQRSIVFDKEVGEEKLYKQIHEEFRSMVDMLIGCFCEDSGLKPEQITKEINKDPKGKKRPEVEMSMLEPVLAAGELELFVHMMMRKNIELQLQALQMIEAMCGVLPQILQAAEKERSSRGGDDPEHQERVILIKVMRESKDEHEKAQKSSKSAELETAMKGSGEERKRLEAAQKEEEALVRQAVALSLTDAKRPASSKPKGRAAPQAEDLIARQAYLRQQRDKLLNMKREARMKAFNDAEAKGGKTRPSTAKAAAKALKGRSAVTKVDPAVLEARKALAAKLKAELM